MSINNYGSNNRSAERDYWEFHEIQELNLQHINQLDIQPCPICELRLIRSHMQSCNHCSDQIQRKKQEQQTKLLLIQTITLTIVGYYLSDKLGLSEGALYIGAFIIAVLLGLTCNSGFKWIQRRIFTRQLQGSE